ncbi:hypothetical protein OJF2_23400 [Aquisphaera giovannonii]|uniref:Uncharacterized protein n=1 Tax=Aquisphaera giovannonii TaxID=406548 RepID=A0A5B9W1G2_9BACT|nr:hypothetical protein [Aquisphaera giovannonii]QEH33810.1 hypothetical protein OJF2_23400 [Aquisphaera giovannonii]
MSQIEARAAAPTDLWELIMQAGGILVLCVLSAVAYGILHDQITARVCIEYFTVAHPPVFPTQSPTWLAIGWGIIATWWVGVLLGVPLAVAARGGSRPARNVSSLVRPILALLVTMSCCALAAGVTGYLLGRSGWIRVTEPLASSIAPEKHSRFLADRFAHDASYLVGLIGGIVLICRVWRSRARTQGRAADFRSRTMGHGILGSSRGPTGA